MIYWINVDAGLSQYRTQWSEVYLTSLYELIPSLSNLQSLNTMTVSIVPCRPRDHSKQCIITQQLREIMLLCIASHRTAKTQLWFSLFLPYHYCTRWAIVNHYDRVAKVNS